MLTVELNNSISLIARVSPKQQRLMNKISCLSSMLRRIDRRLYGWQVLQMNPENVL